MSNPGIDFSVAPGDPARLDAVAGWHAQTADQLDAHAATVDGARESLASAWQGQAAAAYGSLSSLVAAHFRAAAETSRVAARALRRWSRELEHCQHEGRLALAEAERWRGRVLGLRHQVAATRSQITALESEISTLQAQLGGTPSGAGFLLNAKQGALDAARAQLAREQTELSEAEHEFSLWQNRGRQAWQRAQEAAAQATGTLAPLRVSPPPLIGSAALVNPAAGHAAAPPAVAPAAPAVPAAPVTPVAATPLAAGAVAGATLGGAGPGAPSGPAGVPGPAPAGITPVNSGAAQGAITFGDLQEIGKQFGWSQSQLQAWWQVISDESGGNPGALNPSSGAFGIGQFLGVTKTEYASLGATSTNPLAQLNAMAHYIHDRYGDPMAALAHENGFHWY